MKYLSIKWQYLIILLLGIGVGIVVAISWDKPQAAAYVVSLYTRNTEYRIVTLADSVESLLEEQGINPSLGEVMPRGETKLESGMRIHYVSPLRIILFDGPGRLEATTTAATIGEFLDQRSVHLFPKDRVSPDRDTFLSDGITIHIDRTVEFDDIVEQDVPADTRYLSDDEKLYGTEYEESPGSAGRARIVYRVTQKNGKEISRRVVTRTILREPVPAVVRRGTKIVVEAYESGTASWYKFRGCLCAAHPYYPKGSYLRLTSTDTGASVIVRVNDWGPDQSVHTVRIVDLDAEAFKLLAPLSLGTIHVKVEKLQGEQ